MNDGALASGFAHMHVSIVGGTGFIGRHVTCRLARAGADVTTIERGNTNRPASNTRFIDADRSDAAALARALAIASPAVVIDMIAYRREDIDRLLEALPPSVERLVVISSGDVYATYGVFLGLEPGPAGAEPSDEQAALRAALFPYRRQARRPDDLLYSYEKILVEQAANAWTHGATTVLRLPMVYGPNDRQRRVAGYIEQLRGSTGPVRLNAAEASWRCTRGYVEDVAAAISLAALNEAAAGQVFNLGEQDALTELAWARAIAAAIVWDGELLADSEVPPSLEANWSADLIVDTGRIREVLRYDEPVGRKEGLRRTAASVALEGGK